MVGLQTTAVIIISAMIDLIVLRKHFLFCYWPGINVMVGIGLISTPSVVKEAGWASLALLALFAFVCCYTGILMKHCLESKDGLSSYPDIGEAAFGRFGRLLISVSFIKDA